MVTHAVCENQVQHNMVTHVVCENQVQHQMVTHANKVERVRRAQLIFIVVNCCY
jgi:hypothetical protein